MSMDTNQTGGVFVRRFSHELNTVKVGERVRCTDGMRHHGRIGEVVACEHDGRRHPVIVIMVRRDGEPGKRRVKFYSWEKI